MYNGVVNGKKNDKSSHRTSAQYPVKASTERDLGLDEQRVDWKFCRDRI